MGSIVVSIGHGVVRQHTVEVVVYLEVCSLHHLQYSVRSAVLRHNLSCKFVVAVIVTIVVRQEAL